MSGTRIENNRIGTDALGAARLPNRAAAISLVTSKGTVVRDNTIFYAGSAPVQLVSTSGNTITSNVLRSVTL